MNFKILFLSASLLMSACSPTSEPSESVDLGEPLQEEPDPAIAENERNAGRKADLQQIAIALEFYSVDTGAYAKVGGCMEDSELPEKLAPYLSQFPSGEAGVSTLCEDQYFYHAYNDGGSYVLAAELEAAKGFARTDENVYCGALDSAFFTDLNSVSDLQSKLEGYECEDEDTTQFNIIMRESK